MKPYYQSEGMVIYHADCREVLPHVTADDGITDPPYGIHKAEWDINFPMESLVQLSLSCKALGIMPGVWNLARMPEKIGNMEYKWMFAMHLCNGMTRGAVGFGNWIPCMAYSVTSYSLYKKCSDIARIVVGRDKKPEHPCPKPYEAMLWLVERFPGESVLDPFMGSGTTLLAAKVLGKTAIGIETEEQYCEMAAKRLDSIISE